MLKIGNTTTLKMRSALVLNLAKKLRQRGSWCGETHIQKALYFLNALQCKVVPYDFLLYKHGPYSFDLSDDLSAMRAYDFIALKPNEPPYGPTIVSGERESTLTDEQEAVEKNLGKVLDFVAERLGGKKVMELERYATALWVMHKKPRSKTPKEQADVIVGLKRHISESEALDAVKTVRKWTEEFSNSYS